jgi:hypothetical protein
MVLAAACNQTTPEKAVAYNDKIVAIQSQVVGYFDSFALAAERGDSAAAIRELNAAIDSSRAGLKKLEAMEPFDGDTKLRDAAKELVAHYIKGLDQDFRGIVGAITNRNATPEQLEQANQVRSAFKEEEDRLFQQVETAQQEMARKYQFEFEQQKPE